MKAINIVNSQESAKHIVKLTVGNVDITLGYELVEIIASSLPDAEGCVEIFSALAKHPSSTVRASIACKDRLDDITVQLLISDHSIEVLRRVVDSESAKKELTTDQLLSYIEKDVELAKSIADNLSDFDLADIGTLARSLASHSDPSVRGAFARSRSAPKAELKKLLNDIDPDVSGMLAQQSQK